MRLDSVSQKSNIIIEKRKVSSNNDFSDSFNLAKRKRTEEDLENYLVDIKKKGEKLITTKSYADVRNYKNAIKEYLSSVVDYMYQVNRDTNFWENQYFITVNVINEKLEEITRDVMSEQKENIDIASKIDKLEGLLLDVYK